MKNAKDKDWRITEKKIGQTKKVKTKQKKNQKGGFWQGIYDTNDAKIQNGASCAGEDKKSESNRY